jgi:hypothetical protein
MAKLYGLSGKVTGKKGDMVFSVRNGEQIIRQYNPIISNPRTEGQVNARIKMKLMSQLSAIFAPAIAIVREGAKSARNIFSSINYPLIEVVESRGKIALDKLQITKSSRAMFGFTATRNGSTNIQCALSEDASSQLDEVMYVLATIASDDTIRVVGSTLVSAAGAGGTFAGSLPYTTDAYVVLAYGLSKLSSKARVAFDNIEGDAATHVAELIANRTVTANDYTLTETKGVKVAAL